MDTTESNFVSKNYVFGDLNVGDLNVKRREEKNKGNLLS